MIPCQGSTIDIKIQDLTDISFSDLDLRGCPWMIIKIDLLPWIDVIDVCTQTVKMLPDSSNLNNQTLCRDLERMNQQYQAV
jgi:hypothetical protein